MLFNVFHYSLGRVLRLQASNAETTLTLKRNFVRYISHELRSPLNVVYSGIEYLRSKLVELSSSAEVLELVDEVFVANGSAISILDNLLNYESIDAGQFTLEITWKPLHQFLGECEMIQ